MLKWLDVKDMINEGYGIAGEVFARLHTNRGCGMLSRPARAAYRHFIEGHQRELAEMKRLQDLCCRREKDQC